MMFHCKELAVIQYCVLQVDVKHAPKNDAYLEKYCIICTAVYFGLKYMSF